MDIELKNYIESHLPEYLEDLKKLCRQPSVAAQNWGIEECSKLTSQMLEEAGLSTRIMFSSEPRNPIVYGHLDGVSPKQLLFYNHYDVQPADPIEEWESPPFEPTERDGRIYARGAVDNKGNLVARLAAIKAILAVRGRLPCGVKFFIEGAEEDGSPGFGEFVKDNRTMLKANACIWEGGSVDWSGTPFITLGMKGILYVQLTVRTGTSDCHSSQATVVPNAAWRLIWALSTLKDEHERILIPGFYDNIREPASQELAALEKIPQDDDRLLKENGLGEFLLGVRGNENFRRRMFEPTCTICGIGSGYVGEGSKTVLPCVASAKLDFRLVPDQRPEDIAQKLRAHLDKKGFPDVEISSLDGENPSRTPMSSHFVGMVSEVVRQVYGTDPIILPSSQGSGPRYHIAEGMGLPVLSSGVGSPDDRRHATNENVRVDYFLKGIINMAAIMEEFPGPL